MEQPSSFYKNARNQKRKEDKYRKDKEKRNHNKNETSHKSDTDSKPQRLNIRQKEVHSVLPPGEERNHDSKNETISQSNTESKPQRSNLRQKREITSAKDEDDQTGSSNNDPQETKEETVVDHSHLKRETEEIDKLTQRSYRRRQITSNWERYSVPLIEYKNKEDESRGADFASLLQFPQSSGGHLKLKEEKKWAAESEAMLNNYLALDLNILAQGLASIPFYQRHQLSENLFTKDELEKMQATAKQNKELYKSNEDMKTQLRTTGNDDKTKIRLQKTELYKNTLDLTDSIIESTRKINFTKIENNSDEDADDEPTEKIEENIKTPVNTDFKHTSVSDNENVFKLKSDVGSVVENQSVENVSTLNSIFEEISDDNKLLEDTDSDSKTATVNQQLNENVNPVNKFQTEDDEELDFLLSLKEPVKESKKSEKVPVDTSSDVGGIYSPEYVTKPATAFVQRSNLDDWLDSVLED